LEKAARNPALDRLDPFVGEWSMEASLAPGVTGRANFEWALDRQFLVERSVVPGAPDSLAIISLDHDGATFTQHYFDSRGVVRLYSMTVDDGTWILLRDKPDFTPLDFYQRYVGQFSADGSTITGRWETSPDGVSWEKDFDLNYVKV
jgi:hypothetical protein